MRLLQDVGGFIVSVIVTIVVSFFALLLVGIVLGTIAVYIAGVIVWVIFGYLMVSTVREDRKIDNTKK